MPIKPVSSGSGFVSWLAERRFTKVRASQELKVSIGSINRWASLGNEPLPLKAQRLIMDYLDASAPKQPPGRPKKLSWYDTRGHKGRRLDGTSIDGETRESLVATNGKWFEARVKDPEGRWNMPQTPEEHARASFVMVRASHIGNHICINAERPNLVLPLHAEPHEFTAALSTWRSEDEILAERRRAEIEQERQARIRAQAEKEKRLAALPPGLPSVPEGYFNTGGFDPNAPMAKIYVPFEDEAEIAELIKKLPD